MGVVLEIWGDLAEFGNDAVYGNAVDLGVGRRAQCAQGPAQAPFVLITTCYATAHGIVPGQAGFNDFNTITHPGPGVGNDFILSMVISKDQTGTSFLVFPRDPAFLYGSLSQTVSLDTEGPKYGPQVCMSCHGGKYNTTTRKVDGASFLPLDPGLLAFASPAEQVAQEEKIRKINWMILLSDPTSAVGKYIQGLYGNSVGVPGTHAKPNFVPQGWAPQSGFYLSVVKPYCATCHLAAPSSWNFATWSNFQDNAALIRAAVCNAHTMPHAELQYKAFWTKDTGPVYTPGLLATRDEGKSGIIPLLEPVPARAPAAARPECPRRDRASEGRTRHRSARTGTIARVSRERARGTTPPGRKPSAHPPARR